MYIHMSPRQQRQLPSEILEKIGSHSDLMTAQNIAMALPLPELQKNLNIIRKKIKELQDRRGEITRSTAGNPRDEDMYTYAMLFNEFDAISTMLKNMRQQDINSILKSKISDYQEPVTYEQTDYDNYFDNSPSPPNKSPSSQKQSSTR